MAKKKKSIRRCGICREIGHDRNTCPQQDILIRHGRSKPEIHVRSKQRPTNVHPTKISLGEVKTLARFANSLLIAASQGNTLSTDDRRALCVHMSQELPKLFESDTYGFTLDLLKMLQNAGDMRSLNGMLDDIVRQVRLYGGELLMPQIGDPFDYNIHHAVANHPDITPGQQVVKQVIECGIRFGDYFQEAKVMVSQSRRHNPGYRSARGKNALQRSIHRHNQRMGDLHRRELRSRERKWSMVGSVPRGTMHSKGLRRRDKWQRNPEDIRQEMIDLFTVHRNPDSEPEGWHQGQDHGYINPPKDLDTSSRLVGRKVRIRIIDAHLPPGGLWWKGTEHDRPPVTVEGEIVGTTAPAFTTAFGPDYIWVARRLDNGRYYNIHPMSISWIRENRR